MKKLLLILLAFTLTLTGCVDGIADSQTYGELVGGIEAKNTQNEILSVPLTTLINQTKYDDIVYDYYSELAIDNLKSFKTQAICFYVKTINTCELSFELYLSSNLFKAITRNFESDEEQCIQFILDSELEVLTSGLLSVKINQTVNEQQIEISEQFVFDNLIIFFKE